MTSRKRRFVLSSAVTSVVIVAALGCGTSSNDARPQSSDSDVNVVQELAVNVEVATSAYQSTMMNASTTAGACKSIHDQYDANVRPSASQLMQMSGKIDDDLSHHGGTAVADDRCVSATMMDELDYHRSVACTTTDISEIRAEAARHITAMRIYADHMWQRCNQLRGTSDGGGLSGFMSMMQGCENWDGHCSTMMHEGCAH
jgi:hypothetical protein